MKKVLILSLFILFITNLYSQLNLSNVEFDGQKTLVLTVKTNELSKTGKLSTNEKIKATCTHGACYIDIEYKGRVIAKNIGDNINNLNVYEYDFGNDGDKEIVVINEFHGTAYLFVFAYGKGLIKTLFEKEIMDYRTVLKSNYIEFYLPVGLDSIWHYYNGLFWTMELMQFRDY